MNCLQSLPRPATARCVGAVVRGDANERFVDRIHHDLLGRAADAGELGFHGDRLQHGYPRRQVVQAVLASPSYCIRRVQGLYRTWLGRRAGTVELMMQVNHLLAEGEIRDVQAEVLGSAEYFAHRGGGTAAGFLAALFADVLGRPPDATEKGRYGRLLSDGTPPARVADLLLNSLAADIVLVQALTQQFLHRSADPNHTLSDKVREETILVELLGSDGYFARC